MHTPFSIAQPFRDYFESLEQDLGVEIHYTGEDAAPGGRNCEWQEPQPGQLWFVNWGATESRGYLDLIPGYFPEGSIIRAAEGHVGRLYDAKRVTDTETPSIVEINSGVVEGTTDHQVVIAQVKPMMILFPFSLADITLNHGAFDKGAWDAFMGQAIPLALDPEAIEEFRRAAAERERVAMIEFVRRSSARSIDDLISEIGVMQTNYADHVRQAASTRHKLRDRQALLTQLMDARQHNEEEQADKAWQLLAKDERVESLSFSGGSIVLLTTGLDLTHPRSGKTVYLGKFRVTIDLNSTAIKIHNLDNAKGGFDHPHVNMHNPCFGDMGDGIHTLIVQGELYAAVEMIFVFLSSVNLADDWGRRSVFWFEAEDDRVQEAEAASYDIEHDYVDGEEYDDAEERVHDVTYNDALVGIDA